MVWWLVSTFKFAVLVLDIYFPGEMKILRYTYNAHPCLYVIIKNPSLCSNSYSITGANFDFLLKVNPYFMNRNGTGMATVAIAPNIDTAGPTPRVWNIGFAASGNPAAITLLKNVFAATADAA